MAMIRCGTCEKFVDDDYHPCEEHPISQELTCPACMEDTIDEEGE